METIALVHTPSPNVQACERTFVPHDAIDFHDAVRQHAAYCQALRELGCRVRTLDVNSLLPDCAFIEDTAIILDEAAVLGSMGAPSRSSEPHGIEPILREYRELERLPPQATLEGGDVLRIGRTLLVGQSRRTNAAGIEALAAIGSRHGYQVLPVPVQQALHLKTACTALPDGRLLINPAWVTEESLGRFTRLHVPREEPWAANVGLVNGSVLMSAAAPRTADLVSQLGYSVRTADLSEFAKAEGGVTCLALLIPAS
jgi:dimethylargininase